MSYSDRREYLTATVLDQDFLDRAQDNLDFNLEMVIDIETPVGEIHASDRNKFVGGVFYEALVELPQIKRSLGEWLDPTLEFSRLTLSVSNVDGRYNNLIPGGVDFAGWINKNVSVRLGLRDVSGTFNTVYAGKVTDTAGFKRDRAKLTFSTRDYFDRVNVKFPFSAFTQDVFPDIEDNLIGVIVPVIYGDWTVSLTPGGASIPAFPINGANLSVLAGTSVLTCVLSDNDNTYIDLAGIYLKRGDTFFLFYASDISIVGPGNRVIDIKQGGLQIKDEAIGEGDGLAQVFLYTTTFFPILVSTVSIKVKGVIVAIDDGIGGISILPGSGFTTITGAVIYSTGDISLTFTPAVSANDSITIDYTRAGSGGETLIAGVPFIYTNGDSIFVRCKGKDLSGYNDNIVWQARDLLLSYGGVTSGEFDSNWATYRDKASPAQSSIATFKSRIWVQETQNLVEYVLSLLEQVRLEAFISRLLKFKISAIHFEDFQSAPNFIIRNWDVEDGSFTPQLDDRNVWNRANASYAFDPVKNENRLETPIFNNTASVVQSGKEISKKVVFPNLYEKTTVILQLKEMLRLASAYGEFIEVTLTPRAILKDLGEFVLLNIGLGSTIFENVPAMIREIGYDPKGLRIPVKLWSFQMVPFPGYSPGYAGIVGGYNATITQE